MNPESLLSSAWPTLVDWAQSAWRWGRRNGRVVLFVLAAAGFAYVALFMYQSKFNEELVVLTAARGTSSWRSVDRVVEKLREAERVPGVKYTVRGEVTRGAEEISERVRGDRKGNVIGYYQNEKDPPPGMQYLVPLDYDYLHILCRPELLPRELPTDGSAYRLSDVLEKLQYPRVFAGPAESETRQLTERLFERYGKGLERLLNPAIDDWVQAESALRAGKIDLVFFMGPFPSDTVQNFADGQHAVLLGIDEVQDALARHEGESLLPVQLPENAYSAADWTVSTPQPSVTLPEVATTFASLVKSFWVAMMPASHNRAASPSQAAATGAAGAASGKADQFKVQFCPRPLATIATRRLIVCSQAMRRADGERIAAAVQSALASDSPQIGERDARPHGVAAFPDEYRLIEAHPGAILSHDQKPPSEFWNPMSWSPGQFSVVSGIVLFLVGKLFESLKTSAQRAAETRGAATHGLVPENSLFELLHLEFEKTIHSLERCGRTLARDEWNTQQDSLRDFHEKIGKYVQAGELSEPEAEILFAALRNIQIELDLLEPPPPGAPAAPAPAPPPAQPAAAAGP
jgi:hypothetical protein